MATPPSGAAVAAPARATVRRRLRPLSSRALPAAAGLVLAAVVAYAAARETPLFAVTEISVAGGSTAARHDVRERLAPLAGESLAALDGGAIARELESLPTIESASVDRAFPHTLAVSVEAETPLAVVRDGGRAFVVSARGRIIRAVAPTGAPRTPRIRITRGVSLLPGNTIASGEARRALRALAAVPRRFPVRVVEARARAQGIVLVLASGAELRLGEATDLPGKLASAAAVLRSLSRPERASVAYVDATLPNRVVVADESQVVSEG